MRCRFCTSGDLSSFLDLGAQPLSNAYLSEDDLNKPEVTYPLHALVCNKCLLVQLDEFQPPEKIFSDDYAYFSSQSQSWLKQCEAYARTVKARFNPQTVIEIGSNDGYLLQHFKDRNAIGIEPTHSTAMAAWDKGVHTYTDFWTAEYARRFHNEADLIIGNNVLAHVPDLNDFVEGMRIALARDGVITMEFPHLKRLIDDIQFDTIYHEHFSYFSFTVVRRVLAAHGLQIFDVEELPTHGGSLRIYAGHSGVHEELPSVEQVLLEERHNTSRLAYSIFAPKVYQYKHELLQVLIQLKDEFKKIMQYGAPAKGNTLLNYCGIKKDMVYAAVDSTPAKQGKYLPGSRIPIYEPKIAELEKPDILWIMPWNWKEEIIAKTKHIGADYLIRTEICKAQSI